MSVPDPGTVDVDPDRSLVGERPERPQIIERDLREGDGVCPRMCVSVRAVRATAA